MYWELGKKSRDMVNLGSTNRDRKEWLTSKMHTQREKINPYSTHTQKSCSNVHIHVLVHVHVVHVYTCVSDIVIKQKKQLAFNSVHT